MDIPKSWGEYSRRMAKSYMKTGASEDRAIQLVKRDRHLLPRDHGIGIKAKNKTTPKPVYESSNKKIKVFTVTGPEKEVAKATLHAPKRCKVNVSRGNDMGAGIVRSRGRQHISLY